ncbi:MAG TPA: hypothetical protein VIB02_05530 [Candidatus Limnocylindrales bacterium]
MLSQRESEVVRAVLSATVVGPFFPDWEFATLMGVERDETRAVLDAWPDFADTDDNRRAINNAFVNLLGYPHDEWETWASFSDADEAEVENTYGRWRQEANRGAPQGHGGRLI